jgi:hypothetical protein
MAIAHCRNKTKWETVGKPLKRIKTKKDREKIIFITMNFFTSQHILTIQIVPNYI